MVRKVQRGPEWVRGGRRQMEVVRGRAWGASRGLRGPMGTVKGWRGK